MHLSEILLTNFKSYPRARFGLHPKLNIVYGLNGSGKTNLLDAIYSLAMSRSYLQSGEKQLIHWGSDFYRIEGHLQKAGQSVQVVVKSAREKRKILERNGKAYERLSDHLGFMPVVMIAPDDVRLINGDNSDRRRFVDATLSQISRNYLEALITYNHLLRQRNRLLREGLLSGQMVSSTLLESYAEKMDGPAATIRSERSSFFAQFAPMIKAHQTALSGSAEEIACIYQSDAIDSYREQAAQNVAQDRAKGRTTFGPQTDRILLLLGGKPIKTFGSQGQRKSMVLAMKLAQYQIMADHLKVRPILLLDDLFDRLDSQRVQHLITLILGDDFGQIFISDTNLEGIAKLLPSNDYASIEIIRNIPVSGEEE